MRLFITALAGMLLLITQLAVSAPITGLYQVREPIADNTPEARAAALNQAFVTLIQRLTGDAALAEHPALKSYRADPEAIILGYGQNEEELQVGFDPSSTLNMLREAGLPLWGSERPMVLAWWVLEGGQGRQLLGDGQVQALSVEQAAHHRGMLLRFPLADLNEQVQADRGWSAHNIVQAQDALERYGADALLDVRAQRTDAGGWTAQWQLFEHEEWRQGDLSADSQQALADQLFVTLAKALAAQYAVVPGQGEAIQVRIQGINMDRLLVVEKALQVFDAQLISLTAEDGIWQVTALPEQLRTQLALYQLVEETAQPVFTDHDALTALPATSPGMTFVWQ